jgi:hypothetical protein
MPIWAGVLPYPFITNVFHKKELTVECGGIVFQIKKDDYSIIHPF